MINTVERVKILAAQTDLLEKKEAVSIIMSWIKKKESRAVFFCSVHMLMEAYDSEKFAKVMAEADLVCADGRPVYFLQKLLGSKKCEHVFGLETMHAVLKACAEENSSIALFGSSPEVLSELSKKIATRYPEVKIVYSVSPPYRGFSSDEMAEYARDINASGAKVLFVGLGCPKQETWVIQQKNTVQMPMLAVGAAFDFMAERKTAAPHWMRVMALEWIFRLFSEPRRLWRRYIFLNPRFLILVCRQLIFRR